MNTKIWTGDKKMINCLINHNINNFITTEQILDIYINNVKYYLNFIYFLLILKSLAFTITQTKVKSI